VVLASYGEHVLAHVKPGAGLEMAKAKIDPYMLLVSIQRPVIKAEMMGWCSRVLAFHPLV